MKMHSRNFFRWIMPALLISVLLITSVATLIPTVSAAQPPIVFNPSFETPGTAPAPDYWNFTTTTLSGFDDFFMYYPVTSPPPHSGSECVGIFGANPQPSSQASWNQDQVAPIEGGAPYNLSSWIWIPYSDPPQIEVDIGVTWKDISGIDLGTHWSSIVTAPTQIWFEHFVIVRAPQTAASCAIHLRVTLQPVQPWDVPVVHFDDVEFYPLGDSSIGDNTPSDHGSHFDPDASPYNVLFQLNISATWEGLKNLNFTLLAFGSGDDQADITKVDLFHDVNGNGVHNEGTDVLLASGTYSADDGTLQLNTTHGIAKGENHLFLFAYQMNFIGDAGDTYGFNITQIRVEGNTTGWFYNLTGTPYVSATKTLVGSLLVEDGVNNPGDHNYTPEEPFTNEVLQLAITAYAEDFSITEMTVEMLRNNEIAGTPHPTIQLYDDVNGDGQLDTGDTLLAADTGGTVNLGFTFSVSKGATEYLLLVLVLSATVTNGSTYHIRVTALNATGDIDTSTQVIGLPITSATKTIVIPTTPPLPPIPGFPIEAIILALFSALGVGILVRQRRQR